MARDETEESLMRKVLLACSAALLVFVAAGPAWADGDERGRHGAIESLSAKPSFVTGGDVLVAIDVPRSMSLSRVEVELNGDDVTGAFSASADDPRRLVGLVEGLRIGRNELTASEGRSKGRDREFGELKLRNHPISGPLFSGPYQTPFICRTTASGLDAPTDPVTCSAPTKVSWFYRATNNTFKPLANPTDRPADLAQTTTRSGETVDYVVRVESGVINRSVYHWAVLAAGGETVNGWNDRLVYEFGGGCGTGYHQGALPQSSVLDNAVLSQGYAKASSTLNVMQTACNDVLSAETMMMVKERIVEGLLSPPVWTMGWGGSGGAIQQLMIAENYPGLLDGLVPSATFQDTQLAEPPDCRLLNRYFAGSGAALTGAQRLAISGYLNAFTCTAWDLAFANVIVAEAGCDPAVPVALRYNAVTNPTGARCTLWDGLVNIWGRDPATGFARRSLDNVGVQYGLQALQEGKITVDQFLDLNERIGGYDNDGDPRPERSVADPEALRIAYRTGRIVLGHGGLGDVPILDIRTYTDNVVDIHTYIHSYIVRERLRENTGSASNHVMWRAAGAGSTAMTSAARNTMATWLDNIAADDSRHPSRKRLVRAKPPEAIDGCWTTAGQRIDDPAEIDATGPCTQLFPPAATPRLRAGSPLESAVIKCRLRRVRLSHYGVAFTPEQAERLNAVFPDGVCDYGKRGVGQRRMKDTWQSYGS
jgi:Tannase-like family of unknown function (DUF6351)